MRDRLDLHPGEGSPAYCDLRGRGRVNAEPCLADRERVEIVDTCKEIPASWVGVDLRRRQHELLPLRLRRGGRQQRK